MQELSEDMKKEIVQELVNDAARLGEQCQQLWSNRLDRREIDLSDYRQLEHLTYLTEQIRLKLRMLGAPRIYQ